MPLPMPAPIWSAAMPTVTLVLASASRVAALTDAVEENVTADVSFAVTVTEFRSKPLVLSMLSLTLTLEMTETAPVASRVPLIVI